MGPSKGSRLNSYPMTKAAGPASSAHGERQNSPVASPSSSAMPSMARPWRWSAGLRGSVRPNVSAATSGSAPTSIGRSVRPSRSNRASSGSLRSCGGGGVTSGAGRVALWVLTGGSDARRADVRRTHTAHRAWRHAVTSLSPLATPRMRTGIEPDDDMAEAAMRLHATPSGTEPVDFSCRPLWRR